jgi:5-methylthioadenosine/S-adenosylhomocysteine deaminase
MKLLIRQATLDGSTRDILIEDGIITEISPHCVQDADRSIDGRNKAVLPALINGHTHAAMTLFRGYADDMQLNEWLNTKIWPLEAKLTEEDVYWGSKLACLEMIKNGITAFNDMYWHWEATARAVCEMGLRGFLSAVFIDMFDRKKGREQFDQNLALFALAERYEPHVTFTFGPHAIYTVSEESLALMRDFADREKLLIHMHLAETHEENRFALEKYGCTPVEFLERNGILSDRFMGCHGCVLTHADCNILKKHGAKLVHMPVSNMKLAVGSVFPYFLSRKAGVPFCFGTDGCASNNHLDLIETMKLASLLAKFSNHDPTAMPARETFDVATKGAASMFFLGEWEIAVGKGPDLILVDLSRPEMTPTFDLYSNLVYAANGYVVDTVICMGRVLMENRYVPGEETILQEARRAAKELVRR